MTRVSKPGPSLPGPPVICVPARNEAQRLPRLLDTLAAQQSTGLEAPLRVVILANNCSDGTADAARARRDSGLDLHVVEVAFATGEAHAGSARRAALEAGADWLAADGAADGVLLTTDADARVPPDWVAANLAALRDADIVGGQLVIDTEEPAEPGLAALNARIERYWTSVRAVEERLDPQPHDPAPRHGDHTGASLSLRASLYRSVGGLPAVPFGEDNALVARVQDAGGRLRHCPAVRVYVSDRVVGRAEGGMARDMARRIRVAQGLETYLLPNPAHWRAFVARRAALRRLWNDGDGLEAGLRAFDLDAEAIGVIAAQTCPNGIAFVERASRILDARLAPPDLVELDAALAEFDAVLAPFEGAA